MQAAWAKKPETKSKNSSSSDLTPQEAKQLYDQHKRHMRRIEEEQEGVSAEMRALSEQREQLKRKLLDTARQVSESETRLNALEKKIAALHVKEIEIRADLKKQHGKIAKLLAVLQRMGREPPPAIITERDDALKMIRSGMLLNSFFPGLKRAASRLAGKLTSLHVVLGELEAKSRAQKAEQTRLSALQQETKALISQRQAKLSAKERQLAALQKAAERHAHAMGGLGALLKKLDREIAKQSELGAYNADLKAGKYVEIKPMAKKVAFIQPGRMKPAVPFAQAKGLLLLPASGTKVAEFGATNKFGNKSKGIILKTRGAAQVVAPSDGWVAYAGRFRSYGQLLIINAGGGYHILLAGMNEISVSLGQFVLAGEPVAVMGPESGSSSKTPSSSPRLYIEFRKNDHPIDPQPWWATDLRKGGT